MCLAFYRLKNTSITSVNMNKKAKEWTKLYATQNDQAKLTVTQNDQAKLTVTQNDQASHNSKEVLECNMVYGLLCILSICLPVIKKENYCNLVKINRKMCILINSMKYIYAACIYLHIICKK